MYTAARAARVGAVLGLVLFALGPAGCKDDDKGKANLGANPLPPDTQPTEVVVGAKFADIDEAAAALTKLTGSPFRNYSTYDYGRRQDERCRSVIVRSEEDASVYPPKIRARLPLGLVCYVGTQEWRDGSDHGDGTEVVIGPGADQFDYMRLARTRGWTTGVGTEVLIRRMTNLHVQYGIEIVQAEADTVIFRWTRPPWDYTRLSKDMLEVCPDLLGPFSRIVDRNGLEAYLRSPETSYVHLTWH
jgi:hypothetical protein